jgi:hypothetical protein
MFKTSFYLSSHTVKCSMMLHYCHRGLEFQAGVMPPGADSGLNIQVPSTRTSKTNCLVRCFYRVPWPGGHFEQVAGRSGPLLTGWKAQSAVSVISDAFPISAHEAAQISLSHTTTLFTATKRRENT